MKININIDEDKLLILDDELKLQDLSKSMQKRLQAQFRMKTKKLKKLKVSRETIRNGFIEEKEEN